jgi:hypothetical protein
LVQPVEPTSARGDGRHDVVFCLFLCLFLYLIIIILIVKSLTFLLLLLLLLLLLVLSLLLLPLLFFIVIEWCRLLLRVPCTTIRLFALVENREVRAVLPEAQRELKRKVAGGGCIVPRVGIGECGALRVVKCKKVWKSREKRAAQRADNREPRAESGERTAASREQRAESKEQRAESREQKGTPMTWPADACE